MTLYSPFTSAIPQPEANSNEVPFVLPKSNYQANVTIPLQTDLFLELLEWDSPTTNPGSDTAYTTRKVVLTGILLHRSLWRSANSTSAKYDVFINNEKIISFNDVISAAGGEVNQSFFIPIQHSFIESNTRLRIECERYDTGGTARFNVSFIGYYDTKQ